MKITFTTRLVVAASALLALSACSMDSSNVSRSASYESAEPIPMSIGTRNPSVADSFELLFAAPAGTTSLSYCVDAELAACTGGTVTQVPARALSIPTRPERAYFKTTDFVALKSGRMFALVAKDQSGNLIESARVRVVDKTASTGPTLPAEKNLSLSGSGGVSKKLSDVFEGQYLLIDLSGAQCGGCIQLAHMTEADTSMQAIFTAKKCSHVTIVDQLDGWLYNFPASSTTGKHSYSAQGGLQGVARAFGFSLTATPTVLLIDRTGKVVGNEVGQIPNQFDQLCK